MKKKAAVSHRTTSNLVVFLPSLISLVVHISWRPLIKVNKSKVFRNKFLMEIISSFTARYALDLLPFFLLLRLPLFCFLFVCNFFVVGLLSAPKFRAWRECASARYQRYGAENLLDCRFNHSAQIGCAVFPTNSKWNSIALAIPFRFPFSSFTSKQRYTKEIDSIHDRMIQPYNARYFFFRVQYFFEAVFQFWCDARDILLNLLVRCFVVVTWHGNVNIYKGYWSRNPATATKWAQNISK